MPHHSFGKKNLRALLKLIKIILIFRTDSLLARLLLAVRSKLRSDHLSVLNHKTLHSYRTSDTLFILGSGFSLNKLSDYQWSRIKSADTLAFNYAYMLTIDPTYYLCELAAEPDMSKIASDLVKIRSYDNVPKVFKPISPNILLALYRFIKLNIPNAIFAPVTWLPSANKSSFSKAFWSLARFARFLPIPYPSVQTIFRASLDQAIGLGIQLGYTNVVLCGIDLDTKYFFESPLNLREDIDPPPPIIHETPGVHGTIQTSQISLTIIDVIKELQSYCVSCTNTRLYYNGNSSALAELLDPYDW